MAAKKFSMKKTIVRKTEIQLQLSDIGTKLDDIAAKLDDLSILVRQQTELLRRPAPNEPEYKPSAYAESLSNRPLRSPPPVHVDPNLGTL
jgi:hypothetical protein